MSCHLMQNQLLSIDAELEKDRSRDLEMTELNDAGPFIPYRLVRCFKTRKNNSHCFERRHIVLQKKIAPINHFVVDVGTSRAVAISEITSIRRGRN